MSPPTAAALHAVPVGHGLEPVGGSPPVDVLDGRVVEWVAARDHALGRGIDHGADLDVGRGDDLVTDEQTSSTVPVGAHHGCVGPDEDAGAGHQLDPRVVVVREQEGRGARRRVDGPDLEVALIAATSR